MFDVVVVHTARIIVTLMNSVTKNLIELLLYKLDVNVKHSSTS